MSAPLLSRRLFIEAGLASVIMSSMASSASAEAAGANSVKSRDGTPIAFDRAFEEGAVGRELPTLQVPEGSISIVQALTSLGFAASNGEARRKIGEGAVKLDGETVSDPQMIVAIGDEPLKLSLGKKKHGLLTK